MAVGKKKEQIELDPLVIASTNVTLIGETPIVFHRYGAKAIEDVIKRQTGQKQDLTGSRNTEHEFLDSFYLNGENEVSMIGGAFKKMLQQVTADLPKDISKALIKRIVTVPADMVVIRGTEPYRYEDVVVIGGARGYGTPDLRYRAKMDKWCCQFPLRWDAEMMGFDVMMNIINRAGFTIGLGDKRAEQGHSNGLFHVAEKGERLFGKSWKIERPKVWQWRIPAKTDSEIVASTNGKNGRKKNEGTTRRATRREKVTT